MIQNILIIGANGGIGSKLCQIMTDSKQYIVTGWTSENLDLNYPERIFETDLSMYDMIINCAGHNQGSWQGNLKNTWQNQLSMITVNYISNIFLLKHYAKSRTNGRYVWISTTSMDDPTPYQSIYTGTKVASKFSIDLIAKEAVHISILNVKAGLTRTNLRFRNFEGTKTVQEVDATYGDIKVLSSLEVAQAMFDAIKKNKTEMLIV